MEQEESIQLVSHTPEEYENLQMMSKYWRSKSLPVVYMPPLGTTTTRAAMANPSPTQTPTESNYFDNIPPSLHNRLSHCHGKAMPMATPPPLAEIRENSEESEGGRTGTRNSSIRSDNTNNTLLTTSDKMGSERLREVNSQELRESKKRSEWRTLQQHYYPEGDWGWVVSFCAVTCHAITTGLQLYLSNVVYARFNEDLEIIDYNYSCISEEMTVRITTSVYDLLERSG